MLAVRVTISGDSLLHMYSEDLARLQNSIWRIWHNYCLAILRNAIIHTPHRQRNCSGASVLLMRGTSERNSRARPYPPVSFRSVARTLTFPRPLLGSLSRGLFLSTLAYSGEIQNRREFAGGSHSYTLSTLIKTAIAEKTSGPTRLRLRSDDAFKIPLGRDPG